MCFLRVILLTLFSTSVQAQGWYLGAGGGSAEVEVIGHDRLPQLQQALQESGYSLDKGSAGEVDDSSVWNIVVGYQFNPYWALEANYADLGSTSGRFSVELIDPDDEVIEGQLRSGYQATTASLLARYPLADMFYIQARAGMHYWQHELSVKGASDSISLQQNQKDSGFDALYGFGAGLVFAKNWHARVEWQRLSGVEGEEGIDSKTLSLLYNF